MSVTAEREDRAEWVATLLRVARPVLEALANGELRRRMPVECMAGHEQSRQAVTHLEALGRTLAGIAPWLEADGLAPVEAQARDTLAGLARRAIASAMDPASPDFIRFADNPQSVVDAAFFAHGLLRAPGSLWGRLGETVQQRVIQAFEQTRAVRPSFNNWLLFSAMVETFLQEVTGKCDVMRIDYAVRQHEQWYAGDGTYRDGPHFHWDYYNSFVIHPMLLDVLETMARHREDWQVFVEPQLQRARRFAVVQELMIGPDGSFPPLGRSIAYRCGAFQLLAQIALQRRLPEPLTPAGVRCALTAVIRRTLGPAGAFDENGWLRIGLCGHQPSLGEQYISTGSLYLCSVAFLPLGLPPDDPFWADAPQPWTAKQIWAGVDVPRDKALRDRQVPM